jgi:hypothetical protein
LLRSAACASQHVMAQEGRPLPLHWSPFAWLVLVAESVRGRGSQQLGPAWGLAAGDGPPPASEIHECFMDCEQDDSEWNLVQVR